MTGYQSKKKAASAKTIDQINWADHEPDGLVHTAQKPKSFTYNEVADAMNSLRKGNSVQKAYAEEVGKLKLYAAPPQRTWVELEGEEIRNLWEEATKPVYQPPKMDTPRPGANDHLKVRSRGV